MTADRHEATILAIDTATTQVVIATGSPDGALRAVSTWTAGYRHGETLLPGIERFLDAHGVGRADLAGIVVGTGPGAFTGLRVGIATAKGLAHGLGIPLVGVSTAEALISSAAAAEAAEPAAAHDGIDPSRFVLLVPAGPSDRVMIRAGAEPRLLAGGLDPELLPELDPATILLAVDLAGRAPQAAVALGEAARQGLGAALLRAGATRLRAAPRATGELAELVPTYVTLPRGVAATGGTMSWSRDPH
jgi:tRNA threonylcarbamoyl adenosine modification protein YeaZ